MNNNNLSIAPRFSVGILNLQGNRALAQDVLAHSWAKARILLCLSNPQTEEAV